MASIHGTDGVGDIVGSVRKGYGTGRQDLKDDEDPLHLIEAVVRVTLPRVDAADEERSDACAHEA
jgi:hypothetical protein